MPDEQVSSRNPQDLPTPVVVQRFYYADTLKAFISRGLDEILGSLSRRSVEVGGDQLPAWQVQVDTLRSGLAPLQDEPGAKLYFEWSIPRVGKRIDVVLVVRNVVFVMEFKAGSAAFTAADQDQVWDYALDLKCFHETSHNALVCPVLVATEAASSPYIFDFAGVDRLLYLPVCTNAAGIAAVVAEALRHSKGLAPPIDAEEWERGRYNPTPTIIEAALALWRGHKVEEISRSDAKGVNLHVTTRAVADVIERCRTERKKAICFVTGVPGAGKTLVGLSIATQQGVTRDEHQCVFLSGNGPLVKVLREALAQDHRRRDREHGGETGIGEARRRVYPFIQNVHHFRDDCVKDQRPPVEHVAIFDEAQRAWNKDQLQKFMARKKNTPNFEHSEPEFLISCLDRHSDWAVVVCLVGGGQEINTGEAGIGAWVAAVVEKFPQWQVFISPRLTDSEYAAAAALDVAKSVVKVYERPELHLKVSMRAFRSERVSHFVKALLDHDEATAKSLRQEINPNYPLMLTRSVDKARVWLRKRASGTQRYGLVVSSNAQRLRPYAVHAKAPVNPVHWWLASKSDVRSSYYLEDVGTEFMVQGLELDWAGIVWDGDFRYSPKGWGHWNFKGKKWQRVKQPPNQAYLKNAYRVLLTRARQGMVVVVPEGDASDPTRKSEFYDPTFEYLKGLGLQEL